MHHDSFVVVDSYLVVFGPADESGEGCLVVIVSWLLLAHFRGYSGVVHIPPSLWSISECFDDDKEGERSHYCALGQASCNK